MRYLGVSSAETSMVRVILRVALWYVVFLLLPLIEVRVMQALGKTFARGLIPQRALGLLLFLATFWGAVEIYGALRKRRWFCIAGWFANAHADIVAELGNVSFGYSPRGVRVVAIRPKEVLELLCGFVSNEVALVRVVVPDDFQLDEASWARWDEFERVDLLAAAEHESGCQLPGRHASGPGIALAVRLGSLSESIDAVVPIVRLHLARELS